MIIISAILSNSLLLIFVTKIAIEKDNDQNNPFLFKNFDFKKKIEILSQNFIL